MALMNPNPKLDQELSASRARSHLGSSLRWLDLMLRHVLMGSFADAHYCCVMSLEDYSRAGIYADAVHELRQPEGQEVGI